MADVQTAPNLEALHDTYEILGEIHGSERAKNYVARRKDDGADVMITIVTPPPGSENNELSHFAADVKLRSNLDHPSIARVFETRWLAGSALAVISERIQGTTLGEALERVEEFSNPRIAAVLQEVMGALEFARSHGVVHRGVTPGELYFVPDTERVIVSLMPTTIPMTGVPDATSDARTIGMLAWTMLAGEAFTPGEGQKPLAELAPNLAVRVVEATEKMAHSDDVQDVDIPTFLGTISAGDALKQAEVELAAQKELYDEQHRAELQKCENHRIEVEQHAAEQAQQLAEDRAAMEKQAADNAAALESERADFQRIMAEREDQLAGVRGELEKQAQELERRLAEFDTRRQEFEQFRAGEQRRMSDARAAQQLALATAAAQRAASQRSAAERASAAKGAVANPTDDVVAAGAVSEAEAIGPELPPEFDAPKISFPKDKTKYQKPEHIRGVMTKLDAKQQGAPRAPKGERKRWLVPAMAGGVALLFAAAVGGISYMNSVNSPKDKLRIGKTTIVATPPAIANGSTSRAGFMSQPTGGSGSAGGSLAPRAFGSPVVAQPTTGATSATLTQPDTTHATPAEVVAPKPRPKPTPKPVEAANDVNGVVPSSTFELPSRTNVARDSMNAAVRDNTAPRDTAVARRDSGYTRPDTSAYIFRRDTAVVQRDTSVVRRDTGVVRRDTGVVRRDTGVVRRDSTTRRDSIWKPGVRDTVRIRPDSGGIRPRLH